MEVELRSQGRDYGSTRRSASSIRWRRHRTASYRPSRALVYGVVFDVAGISVLHCEGAAALPVWLSGRGRSTLDVQMGEGQPPWLPLSPWGGHMRFLPLTRCS